MVGGVKNEKDALEELIRLCEIQIQLKDPSKESLERVFI